MRNRHSGPQPPVETWEKTGCVQFNKKLRPRVIYSMGVHDVGHYFMVRLHFGATEGGAAAQCNEERHTELDIQSLLTTLFVSDCDMDTF